MRPGLPFMGAANLGLLSKLYGGENAQEGLVGKGFQEQLNAMLKYLGTQVEILKTQSPYWTDLNVGISHATFAGGVPFHAFIPSLPIQSSWPARTNSKTMC